MSGNIIEGVGDEVLLFGVFLLLSLVFLTFISLRGRQQVPPPEQREQSGEHVELDTSHDRNRQSSADGLRSRFHTAAPTSSTWQQSSDSNSTGRGERGSGSDDEEGRGTGDGGDDDGERNEIRIRLIQAGAPGNVREICVHPDITLDQIRR